VIEDDLALPFLLRLVLICDDYCRFQSTLQRGGRLLRVVDARQTGGSWPGARRAISPAMQRGRLHCDVPTLSRPAIAGGDEPVIFVIDDDVSMRKSFSNRFRSVGLRAEMFGSANRISTK